ACRDLIARKVKMVIVFPESESGWETLLTEAHASAIPIIAINRPIHSSSEKERPVQIVPDFEHQGLLAAKWIVKMLNGTGGVLEIRGIEGSTPSIERQAGFMAQLGRNRTLEPLGSIGQRSDDAALRSRLDDLLATKGEKLRAIFAHDARGAHIAAAAIEAATLADKEHISIIAINSGEGLTGIFKATSSGASVECEPNAVRVLLDAVDRALLGDPLPPIIPLRSVVIERHAEAAPLTTPQPGSEK
ncbi:MAG: substrate-binding domain-containing protein, partial [Planctomycetota bacterium]|nr:substrate-binding domain-containing protein [Planctomycetota bacterium]